MGRYCAVVGCTSRSHDYLNRKLAYTAKIILSMLSLGGLKEERKKNSTMD
jgi:hypothetical protein